MYDTGGKNSMLVTSHQAILWVQCAFVKCWNRVWRLNTHFAAMASLRVFRLLNMVLWLGGTLSAKAVQSMAFSAARLPAMFGNVWAEEDNKTGDRCFRLTGVGQTERRDWSCHNFSFKFGVLCWLFLMQHFSHQKDTKQNLKTNKSIP